MYAVETVDLRKEFTSLTSKSVVALKGLSLNVEEGKVFGLLGPNGAGKTTLVKIMLGITHRTSGIAKLLGQDVSDYRIRKQVGYLPENHKYPPFMSGFEILKFFGDLSGNLDKNVNKRIDELLDTVGMLKWKKMKAGKYSKGMLQRMGLAQALISNPDIIFLDEPTDGVDPIGRKEIRDILNVLKDQGKTIFLNSHLLSEVELICDNVAILNKGVLVKQGTVNEITSSGTEYLVEYENHVGKKLNEVLADVKGLGKIDRDHFEVNIKDNLELNFLIDKLRSNEITIVEVKKIKNSLEDMFVTLIKENEEAK